VHTQINVSTPEEVLFILVSPGAAQLIRTQVFRPPGLGMRFGACSSSSKNQQLPQQQQQRARG
jgi:hypothetical protein